MSNYYLHVVVQVFGDSGNNTVPYIIVNPSVPIKPGCIESVPVPDPSDPLVCGCYDSTCGDLAYCLWYNGWYAINKFNCGHQYHVAQINNTICQELKITEVAVV